MRKGSVAFCRTMLNVTMGLDDWPSPYYEVSATSESVAAPEK